MVKGGERLRLTLEPRHPFAVGRKELGQDLDRDLAVQPRVAGAEHFAHAAGAESAHDLIRTEPRAGCQRSDHRFRQSVMMVSGSWLSRFSGSTTTNRWPSGAAAK